MDKIIYNKFITSNKLHIKKPFRSWEQKDYPFNLIVLSSIETLASQDLAPFQLK